MTASSGHSTAIADSAQPVRLFRVSLAAFDRMIAAGVFIEGPKVELLDGQIVEMPKMNLPHMNRIKDLFGPLDRQFAARADVYSQSPIELPHDGRPQPDFALLHPGAARERFAQPAAVFLLIEVSDSTLDYDRGLKLRLYARDGIGEYWIINLKDQQLEVYRQPDGERYAQSFTVKAGTEVACLAFPDDPIRWW
jgi:Uma2 family endonuclease